MAEKTSEKDEKAREKTKRFSWWRSETTDLLVLWIAVTVIGWVLMLAIVDLFYPYVADRLALVKMGRVSVTFWTCMIVLHWSTIASIVGYVAQRRGANTAYWFFVSLLFTPVVGFIGLALVPVIDKSAPAVDEKTDDEEDEDDLLPGDKPAGG